MTPRWPNCAGSSLKCPAMRDWWHLLLFDAFRNLAAWAMRHAEIHRGSLPPPRRPPAPPLVLEPDDDAPQAPTQAEFAWR